MRGRGRWRVRRCTAADAPAVFALIEGAGLPTGDLDPGRLAGFVVAEDADGLAGVAGIEVAGTAGLLRSVVVAGRVRSGGLGRVLVAAAEAEARRAGLEELYLLTTSAPAFFGSLGYETVARATVPPGVAALPEFARLCPASAVCMRKVLGRGAW